MLDDKSRELLMEAQYNFPITDRPFLELARRIGVTEDWVIDSLRRFKELGLVRRIGALVNYRARGMVSALVALRVRDDLVNEVAAEINRDKYVTHNFLRLHNRYNIWYVTKATSKGELEDKVRSVVNKFALSPEDYVILYAEKTYKIDVKFDLNVGVSRAKVHRLPETNLKLEDVGLPLEFYEMIKSINIVKEPFNEIKDKFKIPISRMTELIGELRDKGVIRDFYAMIDPDLAGFKANAMVTFSISDCEEVANIDEATHVVKRIIVPGKWNHNCYFMIHGVNYNIISSIVQDRLSKLGVTEYDVLPSIRNLLPNMARRIEQ
ncbi:Lrp/AsnC family transcriptional regulator [Caldivirga maquilingensis]|uniref:siroheme decarboxylase n=1 Tax=Caldivirga maquilingensis (strain ATCC 700844 / DSM 13496 / JCM 10307 / IC-167) TaxID=397948 RepID=A8MA68_CALMQ|nr:Lrp/AsnC family transcriptional regulator [Caldivirga maquilingensis]ABW01000.1 putative transcriptional regulator, AsnC family [Caldivirga maquilingensis IC-167]